MKKKNQNNSYIITSDGKLKYQTSEEAQKKIISWHIESEILNNLPIDTIKYELQVYKEGKDKTNKVNAEYTFYYGLAFSSVIALLTTASALITLSGTDATFFGILFGIAFGMTGLSVFKAYTCHEELKRCKEIKIEEVVEKIKQRAKEYNKETY